MPHDLPPIVRAFLAAGNYTSLDEWMADSDYEPDGHGGWTYEGAPVDALGAIEGAIESSGFVLKSLHGH
jgi:hypothetical protein